MRMSIVVLLAILAMTVRVQGQAKVTKVDNNQSQVDFGYHLMVVYHNTLPAGGKFRDRVQGIRLSAEEMDQQVTLIGECVLRLPERFVTRYMVDQVFILGLMGDAGGYHTKGLIVIEAQNSKRNFVKTFFHEVAHEYVEKNEYNAAVKSVLAYFDANRRFAPSDLADGTEALYRLGYPSAYAITNAEEEFCELFATLMMDEPRTSLRQYIAANPGCILGEKVKRVEQLLSGYYEVDGREVVAGR